LIRTKTVTLDCRVAGLPLKCATFILFLTGVYLLAGLVMFAVYLFTNDARWVEEFFHVPGAMILVGSALLQTGFAWLVWKQFDPHEPMRKAWGFILSSAACELAGSLAVQVFAVDSPLNFLRDSGLWSESTALTIRHGGLFVENVCHYTLLAIGLYYALRVYRTSGFLGRLLWVDRLVLWIFGAYIVWEAVDLGIAIYHGKHPGWSEIAGWPVDPLLWLLLLEAALLYRSVRRMGLSWVGLCWMSFAIGIALVAMGDIAIWAAAYGYLAWPWSALEWYIWLPASAAFAVAPAYQIEAMQAAIEGRPSESAT
jgi:hypothetical protein